MTEVGSGKSVTAEAAGPRDARPRRHRLRTAFLVVAGLVVAWGVLGALLLPGFFRSQLEQFVSKHTRGSLSIGRLSVNPFLLAAGIHDFVLVGPERDTLLKAQSFTLDASIASFARRGIVLDRIALVGPEVHLTVLRDGRLDWMRLVVPGQDSAQAAAAPPSKPPAIQVRRLSIDSGRLLFRDESRASPYEATIAPIQLALERFSTVPNEQGDHSFTASLVEGGTLHWQGRFSVEPVVATGKLDVDSLSAQALWRWMRSEVRFELPAGRLFLSVGYALTTAGEHTRLELSDGSLRATGVRITEPGRDGDVVTVPALALEGAHVDFEKSTATVARIHSEGARLLTSLSPDTLFSLARLFEPRTPPAPSAQPMPRWHVSLDRFDVSGVALTVTDSTQWPPPTLDLDEIGFETHGLDSDKPLNADIAAHARIEQTGTLVADGRASLSPTFVDLKMQAARVPLRPVQAYLDTFIKLDVVRGNADLTGTMKMGMKDDGQFTFSLRADGRIRELAAADSASGNDFLRLADAQAKGVELDMNPDRFRMKSLELARPSATVALGTDASLNLFRIFPALVPPPPGSVVKSVPFDIDRIALHRATLHFVDHTVEPPYLSRIDSIGGEILHLSSNPATEAHITLAGKADGTAPVRVDARLRPADKEPYAIFTLGLGSYEMTALTPYFAKYVGNLVDRGQMSLDLDYRIEERRLKGRNDAVLDQLTLGQKSHSKDATRLPVGLALALLRDREGKIKLDIPVEGDLDDPHFGIGRVILHALLNLLTKAVMSPFALLGKLIPGGGGQQSLGDVAFAPGADTLAADQLEQMGKLVTALADRPQLKLYVTGVADSLVDRAVLARAALEGQIARQRRSEFFAAGVAEPERAVEASPPDGERARALAKLYLKTFGKDSLGATLPDPELSKGDVKRIARLAVSGKTVERPTWPPSKHPLASDTAPRMEARLLGGMAVGNAELQRLAAARAEVLKHQLVQVGGLPEERVFLKGAAVEASASKEQVICKLDLAD